MIVIEIKNCTSLELKSGIIPFHYIQYSWQFKRSFDSVHLIRNNWIYHAIKFI
jgi:hypothetical protein